MYKGEDVMKKKSVLAAVIILTMGITACSFNSKGDEPQTGTIDGQKATSEENPETAPADAQSPEIDVPENDVPEISDALEIPQGDPVIGIVDKYENDVITIRDAEDEDIVLYFSTRDAQIIEGDTPIAVGDTVEITYTGVQGTEAQPGTAVKVVAESMMYNQ